MAISSTQHLKREVATSHSFWINNTRRPLGFLANKTTTASSFLLPRCNPRSMANIFSIRCYRTAVHRGPSTDVQLFIRGYSSQRSRANHDSVFSTKNSIRSHQERSTNFNLVRDESMLKKAVYLAIFLSAVCVTLGVTQKIYAVEQQSVQDKHDDHFHSSQAQVENRWQTFQQGKEFKLFQAGKSDSVLEKEFEDIHKTRQVMWKTVEYETAQNLISDDLIRAPGCGAFTFNNTVPYFNASTMHLGNKRYIACEGPRSKDIPNFFKMLKELHVTHLVRLTDSFEGETKKCHPYWEGYLSAYSEGEGYLKAPVGTDTYSVRAFDMAYWRDHQGIEPDKLLSLVLKVRQEVTGVNGLLAVHCSAGVGRTGTFLAALAIVDAIDQGKPFSIEEITYRLSLQRPHSVAKSTQYITLHRVAELYSKQKT